MRNVRDQLTRQVEGQIDLIILKGSLIAALMEADDVIGPILDRIWDQIDDAH